jgi:hypothetical protein
VSDPSHRICALRLIGSPALSRVIAGALKPGTIDLLLRAALLNGTILIQTDGALIVVTCLSATRLPLLRAIIIGDLPSEEELLDVHMRRVLVLGAQREMVMKH